MLSVAVRGAVTRRAISAPRSSRMLSAAAGSAAGHVKVEYLSGDDAGIALFTLDRPEARNALGRQLINEFRQAMDQVRYDPKVRVVIVRSIVPKSKTYRAVDLLVCCSCMGGGGTNSLTCFVSPFLRQSSAPVRTSRSGLR